jgi:hypothetical protein
MKEKLETKLFLKLFFRLPENVRIAILLIWGGLQEESRGAINRTLDIKKISPSQLNQVTRQVTFLRKTAKRTKK